MSTVGELVRSGAERLAASGSESPRLDAELLLGVAMGLDRTALIAYQETRVGDVAAERYGELLERRATGEPVAYLRGLREFHGLAFAVDRRALIPRPETELLVDLAEREIVARLAGAPRPPGAPPLRVADVGTGSGAIAVALLVALRRRGMADEVEVVATDVSPDALDVARENAVGHGVADRMAFASADLLPGEGTAFDVLCANLPYVATAELDRLAPDLGFEPRLALDGGADGLDVVRRLLELLPRALRRDGVALLEIGADQGEGVAAATAALLPGWRCEVLPDLAGLPRVARVAEAHAA